MLTSRLPKINIRHSKLLDPVFLGYLKVQPNKTWHDWRPPEDKEVHKNIQAYRGEWDKNGSKILRGIQDVLELKFARNLIDVHIVKGTPASTSHPLILKSTFKPNDFVFSLAHELIHMILQDNNLIASWDCIEWVKEQYPEESNLTKNHLIVHSVLNYIWLDVLNERDMVINHKEKLKDTLVNNPKNKDYTRAWEIIEEYDYRKFIDDYQKRYTR